MALTRLFLRRFYAEHAAALAARPDLDLPSLMLVGGPAPRRLDQHPCITPETPPGSPAAHRLWLRDAPPMA